MEESSTHEMRTPTTIAVIACILIVTGCDNPEAQRVKKLEAENKLLIQFKKDVIELDGLASEGKLGDGSKECAKSEILVLRTPSVCAAEQYAQGLLAVRNAIKGTSLQIKPMTDAQIAQWALVAELNNRYRELDGYGQARFKAVAGAVQSEDFIAKTRPMKVLEYIRSYMYQSQKDFVDGLARTSAGEKTALSVEKKKASVGATNMAENKKEGKQKIDDSGQGSSGQSIKKWTYDQALKEACETGRQYREDVDLHGMKPSQAEYEAKAYSQYLADNSTAPRKVLYDKIKQGLWMDSCF